MVRIESVNAAAAGNRAAERRLADELQRIATAWGLRCRHIGVEDRGHNLLVLHEAGAGRPWVMFDSHMDTVAVDGMTVDPFGGEVRDGKLFGRGACDTKGTGTAALWALKEYAALPDQPNNVAIAFTVDEEYGMTGVQALVEAWPELGFEPVGVIVGEPTRLQAVRAHNGVLRWVVRAHGVAAHSSMPQLGKSAIRMMSTVLTEMYARYIPALTSEHPLTGKAQCSINVIRGGSQANVIPDLCQIEIDRRVTPYEDLDRASADFAAFIQEISDQHADHDLEVQIIKGMPALLPQGSERLYESVAGVLESHGLETASAGVAYATNAGFLSAAGVPCIVLGPGDGNKAHTKDEYIDLGQLRQGASVYRDLMGAEFA